MAQKSRSRDASPAPLPPQIEEVSEKAGRPYKDENKLSEHELRRLFEDEEIERFLGVFADYVSEVTLPTAQREGNSKSKASRSRGNSNTSEPLKPPTDSLHDEAQVLSSLPVEEWVPMNSSVEDIPSVSEPYTPTTLSELIAFRYLLPYLPPARPHPEQFTMGRLRLTIQRLYLTTQPAYGPFFSRLSSLSSWKHRNRSLVYCVVYWTLWYRDLLIPALFTRILFSLLRRKVLPHPTLSELRERRAEIARAERFGEEVQTRLDASSDITWMEIWRLFRVFSKPKKEKIKQMQTKAKDKAKGDISASQKNIGSKQSINEPLLDDATVLDDAKDDEREKDIKRTLLIVLSEIADLHERVKNIFLWRHPSSSWIYVCIVSLIIIITTFLPVKYTVKLVGFIGGAFFWHIVPIIKSLPSEDSRRLPPPFDNSPTDADYAMELISQRIARGEEIRPRPRRQKQDKGKQKKSDEKEARTNAREEPDPWHDEVDWKRWGQRVIQMRLWGEQSVKWMVKGQEGGEPRDTTDTDVGANTFTYPAQYNASPGLLTITPRKLLFTPLASPRPKLQLGLDTICRVKKAGALNGLHVQWRGRTDEGSEEEVHVEKFLWIGGRDEVFARLVGWGGRRWLRV